MTDDDLWIDAALDGELDAAASLAFERRLAAEPFLQARYEVRRDLRAALRQRATYHPAPDDLRGRLVEMLAADPGGAETETDLNARARPPGAAPRRAEDDASLHGLPQPPRSPRPRGRPLRRAAPANAWRAWGFAAGGAVGAVLATLLVVEPASLHLRSSTGDATVAMSDAAEAVSAHTRALLVDHPIEVASSDQHTVRPWLSARLNFVPPVVDLAPQGFALLGARRDVLAGETAAALVYRHGAHVVSVFVRPLVAGEGAADMRPVVVRGFNVLQRTHDGMAFCLVSDMNLHDLGTLADLLTAPPAPTPEPAKASGAG